MLSLPRNCYKHMNQLSDRINAIEESATLAMAAKLQQFEVYIALDDAVYVFSAPFKRRFGNPVKSFFIGSELMP